MWYYSIAEVHYFNAPIEIFIDGPWRWRRRSRDEGEGLLPLLYLSNKTSTPHSVPTSLSLSFWAAAAIRALPRYLTHCTFIPLLLLLFTHVGGMLGIMQIIPSLRSFFFPPLHSTPLPAASSSKSVIKCQRISAAFKGFFFS